MSATVFPTATTLSSSALANNTTQEVGSLQNTSGNDKWMDTTPRIVFLSVFLSVGFIGNALLVITICQSQRFRTVTFFVFIINLAVINICECVFNMTLLLAASILNDWRFGECACHLSAFCLNFVHLESILGLTVTSADRFIASRYKSQYHLVVSNARVAVILTLTWVQALSFSIPIAVGKVSSSLNEFIIYCSVSQGTSIIYNTFSVLLCFILPIILMLVFFVNIIRSAYKERANIRNAIAQQNYNEDATGEPEIKQDIRHASVTGTLAVAWLVLEGPHTVTTFYSQFSVSSELGDITTDKLNYVWYVDLVLLWLRFCYSIALPVAAFTWNKELWKCFKDFILCRKNNSVVDESFKKSENDTFRLDRKLNGAKPKEKTGVFPQKEQRVFQVPVLFATSNGVHIKTVDQESETEEESDARTNRSSALKGKKCDVEGSRDNLNTPENDTSDYDSGNECDPFSVSHPVSIRQKREEVISERKRSLSEPEVRGGKGKPESGETSVSATSEGDSGLDLSMLPSDSLTRKNKFHVPCDKFMLQDTQQLQTEVLEPGHIQKLCNNMDKSVAAGQVDYEINVCTSTTETDTMTSSRYVTSRENKNNNYLQCNVNASSVGTDNTNDLITAGMDSPLPRRKKKRRRDKNVNFDSQSISSMTSNSSTIPPRPPPRLAPISTAFGLKSFTYSGLARPGSSCSSQYSILDNLEYAGSPSNLFSDSTSDARPYDVESITSSVLRNHLKAGIIRQSGSNLRCATPDSESLQLEIKRSIEIVPEEVLSPSGCTMLELKQSDSKKGVVNTGFEYESGNENTEQNAAVTCSRTVPSSETSSAQNTPDLDENRTRNVHARRKRREKMTSMTSSTREMLNTSSRLADNSGYKLLVPETP
ncbi:uncharacterized protein LOC127858619 [Dreissena polymorpha]|uniref:G-protein coupled receptors family 1 profile domain-containing protein n=1 Tax=Dreissena polymorpha TaxID=45954 RepID=A0A9D3YX00_DREPO|nr:uncharacterized protein LOC127858619 [Dreissena polymorpha]KAH3707842.1 hypothetical protein DPMN_067260 [Dreissena polymorpha]